jgi:ribonuclease-3
MFLPTQRKQLGTLDQLNGKKKRKNASLSLPATGNDKVASSARPWQNSQPSSHNQLLTREFLNKTIGSIAKCSVSVKHLDGYQLAFVHKSFLKRENLPDQITVRINDETTIDTYRPLKTYETLEFIGDAFIDSIVAEYLYTKFPNQKEGFLTKLKTRLTRSETFAKFAFHLKFDEYLLISEHVELIGGRKNPRIMEDVFEAFCAAVKQDLGYDLLERFVIRLIEKLMDFDDLIKNDDNYKDKLLRYFQKNGWSHPTYTIIDQTGPRHHTTYTIGVDDIRRDPKSDKIVKIPGQYLGTGSAKAKKKAEQLASKVAIERLVRIPALNQAIHQRCETSPKK